MTLGRDPRRAVEEDAVRFPSDGTVHGYLLVVSRGVAPALAEACLEDWKNT